MVQSCLPQQLGDNFVFWENIPAAGLPEKVLKNFCVVKSQNYSGRYSINVAFDLLHLSFLPPAVSLLSSVVLTLGGSAAEGGWVLLAGFCGSPFPFHYFPISIPTFRPTFCSAEGEEGGDGHPVDLVVLCHCSCARVCTDITEERSLLQCINPHISADI